MTIIYYRRVLMEKNVYREIEGLLYGYKTIEAGINHNRIKLETLEARDGLRGIGYSDSSSKTNNTSSIVESAAIKNIEIREELERKILLDTQKIRLIDNAIEGLTELEKEVITLFYIDDKNWDYVADKVGYSKSWVVEKRKQAIEKMVSYW